MLYNYLCFRLIQFLQYRKHFYLFISFGYIGVLIICNLVYNQKNILKKIKARPACLALLFYNTIGELPGTSLLQRTSTNFCWKVSSFDPVQARPTTLKSSQITNSFPIHNISIDQPLFVPTSFSVIHFFSPSSNSSIHTHQNLYCTPKLTFLLSYLPIKSKFPIKFSSLSHQIFFFSSSPTPTAIYPLLYF